MSEDAVLPRRPSAARAWDDVVDVPVVAIEFATGVLADAAVALPDAARARSAGGGAGPWRS